MKASGLSRRSFLGSLAATAAAVSARGAEKLEEPKLRVGIVSDIHVQHAYDPNDKTKQGHFSTKTFENALRYFREKGVDAVIVAGDLTEYGRVKELEASGIAWNRVFPDDKGLGGKPVTKLIIRGNHDKMGGPPGWAKKPGEAEKEPLIRDDPAGAFKEAYGITDYAPIMVRKVNGYTFILANWDSEGAAGDWIREHAAELPKDKPFFYVQHPHLKGTNIGAMDRFGKVTEALKAFPNAVSFSGHSHYPLTRGDQIWQEEFTAVGTACLQWMANQRGRDNSWVMQKGQVGHGPRASSGGRQGMLMEVYADRIVLERREFITDKDVGPDWVIPLDGSKPYQWAKQKARSVAPEFPKGAVVTVTRKEAKNRNKEKEMQLQLTFPRPLPADGDKGRTQEYEATVFRPEDGEGKPLLVRYAFAERYFLADELLAPKGLVCFAESEFPAGAKLRFAVRAMDSWGMDTKVKSKPIYGDWPGK